MGGLRRYPVLAGNSEFSIKALAQREAASAFSGTDLQAAGPFPSIFVALHPAQMAPGAPVPRK